MQYNVLGSQSLASRNPVEAISLSRRLLAKTFGVALAKEDGSRNSVNASAAADHNLITGADAAWGAALATG